VAGGPADGRPLLAQGDEELLPPRGPEGLPDEVGIGVDELPHRHGREEARAVCQCDDRDDGHLGC